MMIRHRRRTDFVRRLCSFLPHFLNSGKKTHAVYSEGLVLQGIESFYGCRKKISEKCKKSDTDFRLIFDFRTFEKTACPYQFLIN